MGAKSKMSIIDLYRIIDLHLKLCYYVDMNLPTTEYYQKVLLANKYKLIGEVLFNPKKPILSQIEKILEETMDFIDKKQFDTIDWRINLEHDLMAFISEMKHCGKMDSMLKFS